MPSQPATPRASSPRYTMKRELMAPSTPEAKRQKREGYMLNINFALDKQHEPRSFTECCKLPPGAMQGLLAGKADKMLKAFKINTIGDLAAWKHYQVAKAIATLAQCEEEGMRAQDNSMNINLALDAAYEKMSFKDILNLPPSALEGLADWTDSTLSKLHIHTIADLAKWRFCRWAEAIVIAAKFESAEFDH